MDAADLPDPDALDPEAARALQGATESVRQVALGLIRRLRTVPGLQACYLSGSYALGMADRFSDVDLLVFGTDPQQLDLVRGAAREVTWPVLDKVLGRGDEGVVTIVTPHWLRLDIACRRLDDQISQRRHDLALCWTRLDAEPEWSSEDSLVLGNPRAIVEEMIRMMGLLPVLLGRDDPVTAMAGCGGLLAKLIELNRLLLGKVGGGAMATRRDLPVRSYARLQQLPAVEPTARSVLDFHVALWTQLVQLVEEHGQGMLDAHLTRLADALAEVYRRDFGVVLPRATRR